MVLAHLAAIWGSPYPPLVDYPNHLARAFILSRYESTPLFQTFFVVDFTVAPYLGADLLLVPLFRWGDPHHAGRLLLTVAFLLFALGCGLLGRALHGPRAFSGLAATFSFLNPGLLFGFLSYLLGLGLFLCTAALFLSSPRARKPPSGHLFLLAGGSILCYLCHLSAFVFLCLFVGALFVRRLLQRESLPGAATPLLPLLPALGLYLVQLMTARPQSMLRWGDLSSKLEGLEWLGASGVAQLDCLVAGLLAGLVLLAWRSGHLTVSRLALGSSALFALLYASFPEWLYGWAMDRRFLVPAGVLLILSFEPRLSGWHRALMAGALVGLVARPLCVGVGWSRTSETIAEQVELLRALPPSSRVFPLVSEHVPGIPLYDLMAMRHVGHYATLERDAILPTLFAGGGAFSSLLVSLRWRTVPPLGEIPPQQVLVQDVPWALIFQHDYVYAYGLRYSYERVLRRQCRILDRRGRGLLFGPCSLPSSPVPSPAILSPGISPGKRPG